MSRNSSALLVMALRGSALVSKFLLTLFIAKYLGIEAVGLYGYLAGATVILPVALGFGLMRELSRQQVTDGFSAVRERLQAYWLLLVLAYAGTIILTIFVSKALDLDVPLRTLLLGGLILLLEHLNNDSFFVISNLKRPILANFQVFLRAGAWIMVYMPAALMNDSLRTIDWMLAFWSLGIFVSFLVFLAVYPDVIRTLAPRASFNVHSVITTAWRARSVYAGEAVGSIGVYLDRYLVGAILGTKAAGIYVVFASLGLGVYNLVNTGIMQVMRPYMIEQYATGDRELFNLTYSECLRRSTIAAITLSALCGIVLHFALPHIQQPDLLGHDTLMWVLLSGIVIRVASDAQGYVLYVKRQDFALLVSGMVAPITFLATGAFLLPTVGLAGGALASCGAYLMVFALRSRLIKNEMPAR